MAKYSQRGGGQWTISSTLLGWGITGVAILLVGFFLIGVYVGYGMGVDEGQQQVREELRNNEEDGAVSDRIAELINEEEQTAESSASDTSDEATSDDTSGESAEEGGAFSEEDLDFLTEGSDTAEDDREVSENLDQAPGDQGSDRSSGTDDREEQETGTDELYGGNESDGEDTEGTDSPTSDESAGELQADESSETSPFARAGTTDTEQLETFFTIQTVSFEEESYAKRAAENLRNQGHSVMINEAEVGGTLYYRVRVGVFPTQSQAEDYADEMMERGEIEDYWISRVTRE